MGLALDYGDGQTPLDEDERKAKGGEGMFSILSEQAKCGLKEMNFGWT